MRVLIVDDEPPGQTALANVLTARSDVEHFDLANDGVEALEKLGRNQYDVVLLDINMPEMSGFELLDRLKGRVEPLPSIIFVTAHNEHAIAAFAKHAVDYVLKPFSTERIAEAIDVAFRRTAAERAAQLVAVLPQLQVLTRRRSSQIAIKSKGRILFIDPRAVIAVQAEGNFVLLQRESGSYVLRESISAIAEKLREYGFIRIHRSVLVNASCVEGIEPRPTGEYGLRIRGGKEYTVTRTYKQNLRLLAQLWIGTDRFLAE
jgi:two-component system LytT family response regulator